MKVSIVTATYNSSNTIADCLLSINSQSVPVEHVVIDGVSTDNTLDIIGRISPLSKILSEPDSGIYDAMNKGIRLSGGDIIGILNSDDFYQDSYVIEKIITHFRTSRADALFADLVYVRRDNTDKVVRYFSGADFTPNKFSWGMMPPHPTFFVRRELYERYGLFRTDYKIAADFELTARFLYRHRARYVYLPEVIVRMRTGGVSTRNLWSNFILNKEILRACFENDVPTNLLMVYSKYFFKIWQLFKRPT